MIETVEDLVRWKAKFGDFNVESVEGGHGLITRENGVPVALCQVSGRTLCGGGEQLSFDEDLPGRE